MYIDGQWTQAEGGAVFNVFNPATGEKIGEVPDGGHEDAARAVDAAGRTFQTWSTLTAYQRSKYLYDAHRLMTERMDQLAKHTPKKSAEFILRGDIPERSEKI